LESSLKKFKNLLNKEEENRKFLEGKIAHLRHGLEETDEGGLLGRVCKEPKRVSFRFKSHAGQIN